MKNIHYSLKKRRTRQGVGYILPFYIGFVIFFLVPFVWCFVYSFTSSIGGVEFVGLKNYSSVFGSKAFRLALKNTFQFMTLGVFLLVLLSFTLALLLYKGFRGAAFFRMAFLFPMIVPIATLVMTMQIFFSKNSSGSYGEKSFWILLGLYIWKNCGYVMILLLAGLFNIPQDLFRAAQMEGASKGQILRKITIPLMVPMFFFAIVISVANSFKCYREAYLIGGDNPHSSIYMLQHFMNNNYENLNYQRLSVAALFVFLIISIVLMCLFWIKKKYMEVEL